MLIANSKNSHQMENSHDTSNGHQIYLINIPDMLYCFINVAVNTIGGRSCNLTISKAFINGCKSMSDKKESN